MVMTDEEWKGEQNANTSLFWDGGRISLTVDLGTLPRCVIFLLAFSLAILILCLGAIMYVSKV